VITTQNTLNVCALDGQACVVSSHLFPSSIQLAEMQPFLLRAIFFHPYRRENTVKKEQEFVWSLAIRKFLVNAHKFSKDA